jgi:hypothetical protein
VTDANVFQRSQPGTFVDSLAEVLRNGARKLLAQAVAAEVSGLRSMRADQLTDDGRQRLPEREIVPALVGWRCAVARSRPSWRRFVGPSGWTTPRPPVPTTTPRSSSWPRMWSALCEAEARAMPTCRNRDDRETSFVVRAVSMLSRQPPSHGRSRLRPNCPASGTETCVSACRSSPLHAAYTQRPCFDKNTPFDPSAVLARPQPRSDGFIAGSGECPIVGAELFQAGTKVPQGRP